MGKPKNEVHHCNACYKHHNLADALRLGCMFECKNCEGLELKYRCHSIINGCPNHSYSEGFNLDYSDKREIYEAKTRRAQAAEAKKVAMDAAKRPKRVLTAQEETDQADVIAFAQAIFGGAMDLVSIRQFHSETMISAIENAVFRLQNGESLEAEADEMEKRGSEAANEPENMRFGSLRLMGSSHPQTRQANLKACHAN